MSRASRRALDASVGGARDERRARQRARRRRRRPRPSGRGAPIPAHETSARPPRDTAPCRSARSPRPAARPHRRSRWVAPCDPPAAARAARHTPPPDDGADAPPQQWIHGRTADRPLKASRTTRRRNTTRAHRGRRTGSDHPSRTCADVLNDSPERARTTAARAARIVNASGEAQAAALVTAVALALCDLRGPRQCREVAIKSEPYTRERDRTTA